MLESVVNFFAELIFRLGYLGIGLLMTLESSFVPFPSEVVLPPAGYLAGHALIRPCAAGAGRRLAGELARGVDQLLSGAKAGATTAVPLRTLRPDEAEVARSG